MAFSQHNSGISFGRQIVKGRFSQADFMVILCIGLGEASIPFRFSSQLLQLPLSELRISINGLDFVTHQFLVSNHLHSLRCKVNYSCVA